MRVTDIQVYMDRLQVMTGKASIDLSKLSSVLTDEFGHRYLLVRLEDEPVGSYVGDDPKPRRWWWPW